MLNSKDGALMNGIGALYKGSREMPSPSYPMRTQSEGTNHESGRGPSSEGDHVITLILDIQFLEIREVHFVV